MRPETLETDLKYPNSVSTPLTTTTTSISICNGGGDGGLDGNNCTADPLPPPPFNTFKSYVNVDSIPNDTLVMDHDISSALALSCNLPDSKLISYQNYLFPTSVINSGGSQCTARVKCPDEESVSTCNTSASNRSMLTNTTDSTNINSNVRFITFINNLQPM